MKMDVEDYLNSTVYLLIKIGHLDNLKKIQQGYIYCRSLNFYKSLENKAQAFHDPNEGLQAIFQSDRTSMFLGEGDKAIEFTKETGLIDVTICMDFPNSAFCLHAFHTHGWNKNLTEESLRELQDYLIPNAELKKFGNHVLVISNYGKFKSRILAQAKLQHISTRSGLVRYIDRKKSHGIIDDNFLGFIKTDDFRLEREFRFLFVREDLPDPFILNIGDISDITQILSFDDLKDQFHLKLKI